MSELNDPRVLFAAERTLLAWNRTNLSLIAFGFLVERSGILLEELNSGRAAPREMTGAFYIGLAFIMLGVLATVYSSRQYVTVLRTLKPPEFPRGYHTKGALLLNIVMALLGLSLAISLYLARA